MNVTRHVDVKMKIKSNILFVILLFILFKRVSGNLSRIVGGNIAPQHYGMFHASIQNLTGYHICGGAIVSKLFVITAAHCVYGVNSEYMKIVSGTSNLVTGGKQYDVTKVIVYDDYDVETRENDVALLRVKRLFDLRYIKVLKLGEQELIEGDEVLLSGFGAQEPHGISSTKMYSLNLTVFNQETCEFALRYAKRPVTKKMFCTFSRIGEGTCHGDSGSPLIKSTQLVGIVSWGIPCAVGFPDVHTRITPYIEWIRKKIVSSYCVPPSSM